jgi:hypothetical protein
MGLFSTVYVVATLASVHYQYTGQNQFNPGLGIEAQRGDIALHLGEYRNSQSRTTEYLLCSWSPLHAHGFSAGVIGGLAHGYTRAQAPSIGPVNVLAGFGASYVYRKVGVNVLIEPKVIGFQMKVAI